MFTLLMSFLNTAKKNVACERETKGYMEISKTKKNVLGTWESSFWWAGRNPNKIGFRKR